MSNVETDLKDFIDELENHGLWHSGAHKPIVIKRLQLILEGLTIKACGNCGGRGEILIHNEVSYFGTCQTGGTDCHPEYEPPLGMNNQQAILMWNSYQ